MAAAGNGNAAAQAQAAAQEGSLIAMIADEVRHHPSPLAAWLLTMRCMHRPCFQRLCRISNALALTFLVPSFAPSFLLFSVCLVVLQDTITGFLLAGIGHKDYRQNTNFLIVDSSECTWRRNFPMASLLHASLPGDRRNVRRLLTLSLPFSTQSETTTKTIETAFQTYTERKDVAIIIIAQNVSETTPAPPLLPTPPTPAPQSILPFPL